VDGFSQEGYRRMHYGPKAEQVGYCGVEEMLLEQEGVDLGIHLVLEAKIEFAVVELHGQTLKTSFVIGKITLWRYV